MEFTNPLGFMVVALPRSGTTWAANWLTTDHTICLHDPLYTYKLDELDLIESEKLRGISCTAVFRFKEFLNNHPARKLVIHRNLEEINDSLKNEMGVREFTKVEHESLNEIDGVHITFEQLFDVDYAGPVYEYLLQRTFDEERYNYLVGLNIQPNFGKIKFNKEVLDDFRRRASL